MPFQRRCTLYITLTGAPFSSTASSEQCTMVDSRADSSSPPNVERYSGEFCTGRGECKEASPTRLPQHSTVGQAGRRSKPAVTAARQVSLQAAHVWCDDGCCDNHGARCEMQPVVGLAANRWQQRQRRRRRVVNGGCADRLLPCSTAISRRLECRVCTQMGHEEKERAS